MIKNRHFYTKAIAVGAKWDQSRQAEIAPGLRPPSISSSTYAGSLVVNLLALAMPLTILQVYDRVLPNASLSTLNVLIIGLVGVVIVDTTLKCLRAYQINWNAASFTHRLSRESLSVILSSTSQKNQKTPVADRLEQISSISSYGDYLGSPSRLFILDMLFIPIFAIVILIVGGSIFTIPLILCLAFGYFGYRRTRTLKQLYEESEQTDARKNDFILETLKSMATIKALAMEPLILRRFERLQLKASHIAKNTMTVASDAQTFAALYASVSTVGIVCFGAVLVIRGELTLGALACCMLLSSQLLQPILRSMAAWNETEIARLKKKNIKHLFDSEPPLDTPTSCRAETVSSPAGVRITNLTIQYDRQNPIFEKLSFEATPGSIIAIKGADGSGRTSLLRMMAGIYVPAMGNVIVGGVQITEKSSRHVRKSVAYIAQEPTLFCGNILDNLTLFNSIPIDASIDASRLIGLHDEISRMPLGYDTRINSSISSDIPPATAQKICIARAIAKKPALLLFDEANAGFDLASDKALLDVLSAIRGETTVILSTHRQSLIDFADETFQVVNGGLQSLKNTSHAIAI